MVETLTTQKGESLTYHWKFHHVPADSMYQDAEIKLLFAKRQSYFNLFILPDVEGTFIGELTVKDELGCRNLMLTPLFMR